MPAKTVCVLLMGGPWHRRRHTVETDAYESTIHTDDTGIGYYYVEDTRPPVETGCDYIAHWVPTTRHARASQPNPTARTEPPSFDSAHD